MIAPHPLRPGQILSVVAPSGPFDVEAFHRGIAFLRERYEVRYDESITTRHGFLAGDDGRRLAELRNALADDSHALIAVRGGYGATRLLPDLGVEEIAAANKPLVGFSDVTALHAAWARAGVGSWHAPMVAWLGNADGDAKQQWTDALEGAPTTFDGLVPIHESRAVQGHLVGGNLAVLAALAGTPHAPPLDDAVLLLEEVGEAPYRIDRMLTTLRQAGWFDRVAGVLFGQLHQCEGRYDTTAEEVVRAHFRDTSCSAWLGAPVGHGPENTAVPLGARVEIEGRCARVRTEPGTRVP